MRKYLFLSIAFAITLGGVGHAQLMIDFNSLTQDNGPHPEPGFQSYDAGHEVVEDFVTNEYSAFGTTVSLTPTWPDTTDRHVMQMIDRGAGNDATWLDVSDAAAGTYGLDFVTDWIGIDTRTGNGGNGEWWPVNPVPGELPTTMHLTLGGLPAGNYEWTSFHHDTENVHGTFEVQLSTDGGSNFTPLPNGFMSDGTPGGSPDSVVGPPDLGPGVLVTTTAEMDAAGAIYRMDFAADGTNDVVLQFQPYALAPVHEQLFAINGFILEGDGVIGPGVACDADSDTDCDLDDLNAMYLAAGSAGAFDFDGNGTIGGEDLDGWLAAASMSSNTANPTGRTLVLGDVNLDFAVDSSDLGLLLNNFGSTAATAGAGAGYGGGDLNMNGTVDSSDLGLLLNNFGASNAAVPEPTSTVLLLLASLSVFGVIRRR